MAKKIKETPEDAPKKGRGRKIKTVEALIEDIAAKRKSLKSIFLSGDFISLRELESLFTKAMASEMGVNHTNFTAKFRTPVNFSLHEIHRLAHYIGIDPQLISKQADMEIASNKDLQVKLKKFKSVKDMKQYNSK
ncbi:hypothetical protein [Chitinophaga agri]|uniref:Uncharacterized protein n=1 Tax=Chitinophaga agri TaxID=2703787 RepID=A0A6B9ZGF1_9BACT|nr:hypothetical protein [Chitinophaga agri]QHS60819.1 hypothetical protein GWR21_14805 [Chitinophaga agri]